MGLSGDRGRTLINGNSAMDTSDLSSTTTLPDLRDVLERDQRTVITPTRRSSVDHCYSYYTIRSTRVQRFGEVLTLCACILGLVRLPLTMSAPVKKTVYDLPPIWINPCHGHGDSSSLTVQGAGSEDPIFQEPLPSEKEILMRIVHQTNIALHQAQSFREDYVQKTFKVDFVTLHENWKQSRFQWLPSYDEIPKILGEGLSVVFNRTLEKSTALQNAYQYLQRVAVGMEQIAFDKQDLNEEFQEEFNDAQYRLRQVLCEIHAAMLEFGVRPMPDVQRDIMPKNERLRNDNNESSRHIRDWIIFRDYMNVLEFTAQSFEHLSNRT